MDTTRASLLLRIKDQGDSVAWREFDAIYRPLLFRLAMARGFDRAGADDVVQQCMLNVHRYIDGFEYDPAKGRFKAWLRTMAVNHIKNVFRSKGDVQGDTSAFANDPARDVGPEEVFDKLWMEEHLGYCLKLIRDEVEPKTYEAFQLYALEELSVQEVCTRLGIEPALLYRIKYKMTELLGKKMREVLGDEFEQA